MDKLIYKELIIFKKQKKEREMISLNFLKNCASSRNHKYTSIECFSVSRIKGA